MSTLHRAGRRAGRSVKAVSVAFPPGRAGCVRPPPGRRGAAGPARRRPRGSARRSTAGRHRRATPSAGRAFLGADGRLDQRRTALRAAGCRGTHRQGGCARRATANLPGAAFTVTAGIAGAHANRPCARPAGPPGPRGHRAWLQSGHRQQRRGTSHRRARSQAPHGGPGVTRAAGPPPRQARQRDSDGQRPPVDHECIAGGGARGGRHHSTVRRPVTRVLSQVAG